MGKNENDYKGYEKHRRAYRKSDPANFSVVVRHLRQSLEPPIGDGPLTNGVLGTDVVNALEHETSDVAEQRPPQDADTTSAGGMLASEAPPAVEKYRRKQR
jgi:hypothetical protein